MDREKINSSLVQAILSLKTLEECENFFGDICSTDELKKIANRFEVAILLCEGATYREILESSKTSNATISRIKSAMMKEGSILKEVINGILQKDAN